MKSGGFLSSSIIHLLRRVFLALGLDVRFIASVAAARAQEKKNRELESWRLLAGQEFGTILDVGANEGQFARLARILWPSATVHSFEPLPDIYEILRERYLEDPQVNTYNLALGESAGVLQMHRSAFSPSSSLLPMADLHRKEWPKSAEHIEVEVRVERLDDWADRVRVEDSAMLAKIRNVEQFVSRQRDRVLYADAIFENTSRGDANG